MKRYILSLVLCALHLYSFAQYESLLNKSFAERSFYFDTVVHSSAMSGNPEGITQNLRDIVSFAGAKGNNELYCHAQTELYAQLLRNSYSRDIERNTNHDSLSRSFQQFIRELAKSKYKYLYPNALATYASHLDNIRRYNTAFEYNLRAYGIYADYSVQEYPVKIRQLRELGGSYYKFRDYHSAKKCLKESLDAQDTNSFDFSTLNTYALCFRNLHNWDSALHYFTYLVKLAEKSNSTEWRLIATLNIGHTYYLSGNHKMAEATFISAYQQAHENNTNYGISESTGILARLAYIDGDYSKAKRLALEGTSVFPQGNYWYYHYKTDAQNLYEVLADIYEQEGNFKAAYLYLDSLVMVVDSTSSNRLMNLSNAIETKNRLLLDKYLQEKKNTSIEKAKTQQLRNGIVIGIVLLAIISVLFVNRQNLRRKQLEAEKRSAEAKLVSAKEQLNTYTLHLQEKNALLEEFTQELEAYTHSTDTPGSNKTIQKLRESTILTDADWDKFRQMFEQVHEGYLYRLKDKIPNLTPGETRFIVLSKLRLSPKEMAGILGVGPSTIRKYRHQVRNKLGLPEDGDISEVIDII